MGMSMDDLLLLRLCAEAMGFVPELNEGSTAIYCNRHTGRGFQGKDARYGGFLYDPLHDDAQAIALEWHLIQNGYLHYEDGNHLFYTWPLDTSEFKFSADFTDAAGRRHTICECIAALPAGGSGG